MVEQLVRPLLLPNPTDDHIQQNRQGVQGCYRAGEARGIARTSTCAVAEGLSREAALPCQGSAGSTLLAFRKNSASVLPPCRMDQWSEKAGTERAGCLRGQPAAELATEAAR